MTQLTEHCRLLVPDGSLQDVVLQLLTDAGIPIAFGARSYRGHIGNEKLFPPPDDFAKKLRPWDAPWIVADQLAELAFSGDDLIAEAGCEGKVLVLRRFPLSRGGVGGTRLVFAVPKGSVIRSVADLTPEHEVVTEYPRYAARWLTEQGVTPRIRQCHGSLEAFLEIADAIIENTETGTSLRVGGWEIITPILESQVCLITYPQAMDSESIKATIDAVCLLLDSVMEARQRRMVKYNCTTKNFTLLVQATPAAGKPTVNELSNGEGFAVETIVLARNVPDVVVRLKTLGATAIVVHPISHFVL